MDTIELRPGSNDESSGIIYRIESLVPETITYGHDPRVRPNHDIVTRLAFHTADLLEVAQKEDADTGVVQRAGEAFWLLREVTERLVWREARRYTDFGHQDIVDDVYAKVYQNLGLFEGRSRFTGWLYAIARNHSITTAQRQAREELAPLTTESADKAQPSPIIDLSVKVNPAAAYLEGQITEDLQGALKVLEAASSLQYRILLHVVDGMQPKEIAKLLSAETGRIYRPNTVVVHLKRARETLAEELELRRLQRKGLVAPFSPDVGRTRPKARRKALAAYWVTEALDLLGWQEDEILDRADILKLLANSVQARRP